MKEQYQDVFSVKEIFANKEYEVYFIESWSGYSHPVKLGQPLSYQNAIRKNVFYKAYYAQNASTVDLFARLVQVEVKKCEVSTGDFAPFRDGSQYFRAISSKGDGHVSGAKLTLLDAIHLDEYIYVECDEHFKVRLAQLIRKEFGFSYDYLYNDQGVLKKVRLTGSKGSITEIEY